MQAPKILILERSETLAEQVRTVVADLYPAPEVVTCTRTGSMSHVGEHEGPFSLLIAGPSLATSAGLRRLAAMHRDDPSVPMIVSFGARPDASLRQIVQVGAIDLLEMPVDDGILRAAIKRGLGFAEQLSAARRQQQAADGHDAPHTARVFTVCSATGGCGKTFYAANVALHLACRSGGRVALVDLDLQFGEVTTALRLQPKYTIADVLASGDDEDGFPATEHIEEYLTTYEENLFVLPAPREPSQADRISPVEVTRVLDALRTRFDYVIVDTPTALAETVLAAMDLSEHMFVMTTLDLPSVRNLSLFVQTLEKLKVPTENISLVLNKVEHDTGIEPEQVMRIFPQGFRSTLPYAREVSKSVNMGKPVIASFPETPIARQLLAGLHDLLPEVADPAESPAGVRTRRPSSRFRLFRREPVAASR